MDMMLLKQLSENFLDFKNIRTQEHLFVIQWAFLQSCITKTIILTKF